MKRQALQLFQQVIVLKVDVKCAMGCHLLGRVIKLGLGLVLEEVCEGAQVQAFRLDHLLIL